MLSAPLVVEVRSVGGALAVGEQVVAEGVLAQVSAGASDGSFGAQASAVTGADGRARFGVRLATVAGDGQVRVTVPRLGVGDSASYRVTPATPSAIQIEPKTLLMRPGESTTMVIRYQDQFGNLAEGAGLARFVADGDVAAVSGTGTVTAHGVGRGFVAVAVGLSVPDTVLVDVYPPGRLLARNQRLQRTSFLVMLDTDVRTSGSVPRGAAPRRRAQEVGPAGPTF